MSAVDFRHDVRVDKTFFNRDAVPENLLSVHEWRRLARATGTRSSSWRAAALVYAARTGGALVLRADDRLMVFTRREGDHKVYTRTYKPGRWGWM